MINLDNELFNLVKRILKEVTNEKIYSNICDFIIEFNLFTG